MYILAKFKPGYKLAPHIRLVSVQTSNRTRPELERLLKPYTTYAGWYQIFTVEDIGPDFGCITFKEMESRMLQLMK